MCPIRSIAFGRDVAAGGAVVLPAETCGRFFIASTMINGRRPCAMVLETSASVSCLTAEAAQRAGGSVFIGTRSMGGFAVRG